MIAQRIAVLRKQAGFTQTQLAKELNITPSALGNYEQGRRLPSVEMLVAMSTLFDVSLDYLITGKEHGSRKDASKTLHCPCTTCYWANRNHIT